VNKLDLNIPLCYNSEFMELGPTGVVGTTLSWFPWVWGSNTPAMGPGWTLSGRPGLYAAAQSTGTGLPMLFMPDGSKYSFPSNCGTGSSSGCGPDGQNANIFAGLLNGVNIVYLPNGDTVRGYVGQTSNQVYDTNGNHISYTPSSVTDTVGRTINVSAGNAVGSTPAYISFQYPDPSGKNPTVTVTVQMAIMQFTCNAAQNQYGINGTYAMPSAVILPNGTSYNFQYNGCGLLQKVTYPSGGYTRYDYTLLNFSTWITDSNGNQILSGYPVNELAHKYACISAVGVGNTCNAPEQVTTYNPVTSGVAYNNNQMTVVDPVGNTSVYEFSQPNPLTFSGVQGVETSREFWDANGKFLKAVQTQYATTTIGSCNGAGPPSLPTVQTTILDNGMESEVQWSYDCQPPESEDTVLTEKREYDFGQGHPGALLRSTDYTWLQRDPTQGVAYGWPSPQGGAHILDRKTSEVVYDGSGNIVAQTKWVYDNGSAGPYPRGNLTAMSKWRNTDNTWLTTKYVYYGDGNIGSKQDPNGNITNYIYDDNYSDGVNRNSNAFLTKTIYANGATTQSQYNWGSGLITASCGENFTGTCKSGVPSSPDFANYAYDVMGRRISTTTGDGGESTTCYSDTPGASCFRSGYPLTVTSTKLISSDGVLKESTEALDGVGRVTETQLDTDPSCSSGTDNVDTYYDLDGRVSAVSNPYCSDTPIAGNTIYTYDGLGRTIQVTHPDNSYVTNSYIGRAVLSVDEGNGNGSTKIQHISQKDALGRLTSVCEVTSSTEMGSSSTPAGCGLDIAGTGFVTQYAYDTLSNLVSVTQGGSRRSFSYDSLSELKSAANPESGTTTYDYDNDSNLTSKTDARGIKTAYSYDVLNRLTGKSYSDSSTPAACFQYDQGATNGMGRLTAEWTQAGTCASSLPGSGVLTERTFPVYDLMGRVAVDQQCSSPGNCTGTPYSVDYGYDLAGDLSGFTNGLANASAMSFSSAYDSAGRLSTTAGPKGASSPGDVINLFTAIDYTPWNSIQDAEVGPGIALHRDYNSRLLPVDETDKVATTPGAAAIQITGQEQFSGMTTGTIAFTGAEQSTVANGETYYDSGLFLVSINGGAVYQIQYNQNSTPQSLAAYLPQVMSCAYGPVKAVAVGATVTLTSCTSGTGTNYSISAYADGHSSTFANYSFAVTTSGPTMTLPPATYATGTVVINKIGQNNMDVLELFFAPTQYAAPASVGATGTSTASAVASALAAQIPPCSAHQYFSAVANGPVIDLTSCTAGYGGNYSIQAEGGGNSFTMTPSGSTLTGGVSLSGLYDAGTVNLTVNGTVVASAPYGEGATPASIASALVTSGSGNNLVTLSSSGADVTMTAKGDGTITDYAYQLSSDYNSGTFGQPSFSASSPTGDLQGG
jgi:YD repeat-containing protein